MSKEFPESGELNDIKTPLYLLRVSLVSVMATCVLVPVVRILSHANADLSPVEITLSLEDMKKLVDEGYESVLLTLLRQQLSWEYMSLHAKGMTAENNPEAYQKIKQKYLVILRELFGERDTLKYFNIIQSKQDSKETPSPETTPPEKQQTPEKPQKDSDRIFRV